MSSFCFFSLSKNNFLMSCLKVLTDQTKCKDKDIRITNQFNRFRQLVIFYDNNNNNDIDKCTVSRFTGKPG